MYIGPEVMMPLASALAGVVGVLLMFWRRTVSVVRAGLTACSRMVSRLLTAR
jgi:hypothetical protein